MLYCSSLFYCWAHRTEYHEYQFTVTPHMISDLTNTPRDLALHTLFHDTAKVTQTIIGSLTKETVDSRFYPEIVKSFRHSGGDFQPHWPPMVIEEMLHPKNIVSRRGSIGQLYRQGCASEKSRPSTPEMRMSKRIAEAAEEAAAAAAATTQLREYEYLMQVLTVRKKQGGENIH